jgi:large subunit ribosomal protein L30e
MAQENEEIIEENIEQEAAPKKKKVRKVVRRKKTKKEKEKPLTAALRLAVESGKVEFGSRKGLKASLLGKAKLFVVCENTPADVLEKIKNYSKISDIPLISFDGSTMELGSVCGKPYPVSLLSVYDPGTSPIMDLK